MNRRNIEQKKLKLEHMMVRHTPGEAKDKVAPLAREAFDRDEMPAEKPFAGNEVRGFLNMIYDSMVISGGEVGGGKFCNDYFASLNETNQKLRMLNNESTIENLLEIAQECGYEFDSELWWNTVEKLKIKESEPARFQVDKTKKVFIPINSEVGGMIAIRAIAPQLVSNKDQKFKEIAQGNQPKKLKK